MVRQDVITQTSRGLMFLCPALVHVRHHAIDVLMFTFCTIAVDVLIFCVE